MIELGVLVYISSIVIVFKLSKEARGTKGREASRIYQVHTSVKYRMHMALNGNPNGASFFSFFINFIAGNLN